MADNPILETFSTPVDSAYTALIGHATYAFGYLEWQIDHLAEKLEPGFIFTVEKKTAGKISDEFQAIVARAKIGPLLTQELDALAICFKDLVKTRNRLVHAHPATIKGEQRLNYWSKALTLQWEPEDIVAFIRNVENAANEGARLYYDSRMP